MNVYESCSKCGNKHPSVYKSNVCINCRPVKLVGIGIALVLSSSIRNCKRDKEGQ